MDPRYIKRVDQGALPRATQGGAEQALRIGMVPEEVAYLFGYIDGLRNVTEPGYEEVLPVDQAYFDGYHDARLPGEEA